MSAIGDATGRKEIVRLHRASIAGLLAASVLFLVSAVLQHLASLQRWVVLAGTQIPGDVWIEDHRFDYSFPVAPWEPIGTAAQLFGAATLIQALGVLAMVVGVLVRPGAAAGRNVNLGLAGVLFAVLVAAAFGIKGAHALISGVDGVPSGLQENVWLVRTLLLLELAGLIALAALWRPRFPAAMAACMFLLGSTVVGEILANYMIAPLFAGYGSHDTTPWFETVVAASTAIAAICMIFAVGSSMRRGAASN